MSVATSASCHPMLELLFPERGCLRFSTSNNSLKSSFLHNCILGEKKDATLLHVYKWKLECHIFKYGIHLDLMTKSRNFVLHYKEKCSPLKKSQFLGSLRVFQKEIWLTLRAIWYSLLPSSVDFFFTSLFHSQTVLTLEQLHGRPSFIKL